MLILILMTQLCFTNSIWVTSQARQEHKYLACLSRLYQKSKYLKILISRAKCQRCPPLGKGTSKL